MVAAGFIQEKGAWVDKELSVEAVTNDMITLPIPLL